MTGAGDRDWPDMEAETDDGRLRVAAIVYDKRGAADDLLAALITRLRDRGIALAGLIQHNLPGDGMDAAAVMVAEDLATGQTTIISESRGAAAAGCRLDTQGLAAAAALAAGAIPAAQVVVLSKFGKAEADGRGLRAEFVTALSHAIPLVTSVPASRLADWEAFLGGPWHHAGTVPIDPQERAALIDDLASWCVAEMSASGGAQ